MDKETAHEALRDSVANGRSDRHVLDVVDDLLAELTDVREQLAAVVGDVAETRAALTALAAQKADTQTGGKQK